MPLSNTQWNLYYEIKKCKNIYSSNSDFSFFILFKRECKTKDKILNILNHSDIDSNIYGINNNKYIEILDEDLAYIFGRFKPNAGIN